MKFTFISTMWGSSWGGSEFLWAEAAREAVCEGHEVAVVQDAAIEAPPLTQLRSLGVGLIRRPRRTGLLACRAYERYLGTFREVAAFNPDVILISLGSAYDALHDLELNRFLDRSEIPYIILCQHCPEYRFLLLEHRERALRFYRGARLVAFVAERNRRALEQQLVGEIPHAKVVRNPVNLDSLAEVPWPDRGPVGLACVARLDANYKGQDVLFGVLGDEPWLGRDWTLRLYGEGPHRDYLTALAGYRGIADRTEFRGHVRDVRSIWAENQLALFPSRSEGTPLAMVEAMTCGRPIVASDVGGNAEWVAEPSSGFLAEAPSAPCFGSAMERAWAVRGRWEEIGREARRVAIEQMDPSAGRTLLRLIASEQGRTPELADVGGEVR